MIKNLLGKQHHMFRECPLADRFKRNVFAAQRVVNEVHGKIVHDYPFNQILNSIGGKNYLLELRSFKFYVQT